MSDKEKINIYVPEDVGRILNTDAMWFEVLKRDGTTVNQNRFLSMLIFGYYNSYATECGKIVDTIKHEIRKSSIASDQSGQLAESILKKVFLPEVPPRKGKRPGHLSLKPTKETEGIISKIVNCMDTDDYVSQYLCRMFMNYCRKPLYEREQIVFKDNFEFLVSTCQKKLPISFSTIWDTKTIREVVPYKLVAGREEMFNYLLCQQVNDKTGQAEARAYRLNRITNISNSGSALFLTEIVHNHLDAMKKYGPQYAINDLDEICVKLSKHGAKFYNRIYYGRPDYERIERRPDGIYYYFKCSKDQIFFYFRRFEANEAVILYPASLRQKMIAFHSASLAPYFEREGYSEHD